MKTNISILLGKDNETLTSKIDIVNCLQEQFYLVFSNPDAPGLVAPDFPEPLLSSPDSPLSITVGDIREAILDIKSESAAGQTLFLLSSLRTVVMPLVSLYNYFGKSLWS